MIKLILSIIGLVNAVYLTVLKLTQTNACLVGNSCQDVINSAYSTFASLPVSVYGIAFFLAATYSYKKKVFESVNAYFLEFCLTLSATLISIWFIFAQAFLIKSFCFFCTLSAILIFTLFTLTVIQLVRIKKELKTEPLLPSSLYVITFFLCLFLPILLAKGISNFAGHYIIKVTPSIFAKTTIGNITIEQINNHSGIQYITNQNRVYDQNVNYVFEILVQKEIQYFNIPIGFYYQLFVDYGLDVQNQDIRNKILGFGGNLRQINTYLKTQTKLDQKIAREHYMQLKNKVFKLYNVHFTSTKKQFKVAVKKNPFGGIGFGKPSAPIYVIVFSDFLCSHCRHFHEEFEKLMIANKDLLKVEFRQFPHSSKLSEDMSKIAVCSGKQNRFLPVASAFYKNQKTITYDNLYSFIPEDTNLEELKACVNSYQTMNLIKGDLAEVSRLNINSTPTVIVNGYVGNIATISAEIAKLKRK